MKCFAAWALAICAGLAPLAWAPSAQAAACCRVPAGTLVQVELADPVGTRTHKAGDSFALRVAAPAVVGGRVVLRAGTPGVGQVVEASGPGFGGKAAKLVLSASYIQAGGRRAPLRGLQLAASGKGNVEAAQVIGLSGIVLGPIGFVGMAVRGGNVEFPAGTKAFAKLSTAMTLPSLGRATPADRAQTALASAARDLGHPLIVIPPPPRGQAQIVFFRAHSLLGAAQWFNVRENGQALGKLTNGAYFVKPVDPGPHTYTATAEPEFKDSLKLQVDPDETYFVEGILTKGVVIGAADLIPSDRAAFDRAAATLKPTDVSVPVATPVKDSRPQAPGPG